MGPTERSAWRTSQPTWPCPSDMCAYLMTGSPSLDALRTVLTADEIEQGKAILARGAAADRAWQEWSLSRLAVKRAAHDVATREGTGAPVPQTTYQIKKTADGAPYLDTQGASHRAPSISLAHAEGVGVGAAASGDWRIGIDFDLADRVRDASGLIETITDRTERGLFDDQSDPMTATMIWGLKEATAKALGIGLQGRADRFAIAAYDSSTGIGQVHHQGHRLATATRTFGNAVFSLAFCRASGVQRREVTGQ